MIKSYINRFRSDPYAYNPIDNTTILEHEVNELENRVEPWLNEKGDEFLKVADGQAASQVASAADVLLQDRIEKEMDHEERKFNKWLDSNMEAKRKKREEKKRIDWEVSQAARRHADIGKPSTHTEDSIAMDMSRWDSSTKSWTTGNKYAKIDPDRYRL
jgi:hypothetical protein